MIVKIKEGPSLHHTHADGRHLSRERQAMELVYLHVAHERFVERHPCACDGCRTRSAVGLEHVTVAGYREVAEPAQIDHRAQAAPHQSLYLHGTTLAPPVLTPAPRVGGGRQHRVLGRDPALARTPAPGGHALLNRRGADHARVAELGKAGAVSVLHDPRREGNGTQLVRRPPI